MLLLIRIQLCLRFRFQINLTSYSLAIGTRTLNRLLSYIYSSEVVPKEHPPQFSNLSFHHGNVPSPLQTKPLLTDKTAL